MSTNISVVKKDKINLIPFGIDIDKFKKRNIK